MDEIERKFLVKRMPEGLGDPVQQERYYLVNKDGFEIRIQKKGDRCELERKVTKGELSSETVKTEISETEYNELKKNSDQVLERENYKLSHYEGGSLKVYKGKHKGLTRAEFEFGSEEEAKVFEKPEWVGEEITLSPIGRDGKLVKLSKEEFDRELKKYE